MNYSLKKVRTFKGVEGGGFNADLHRNGKKVAEIIEDASGGPKSYEWGDRQAERVPLRPSDPNSFMVTPLEREFFMHVESLPPYKCPFSGKMERMSNDVFIGMLLSVAECRKLLKKKTVFRASPGDGWAYFARPYNKEIADFIRTKYGQTVTILNETDVEY
jgi:hypothetical protein